MRSGSSISRRPRIARADEACIENFQRRLRAHGLVGTLLPALSRAASRRARPRSMHCIGLSRRELLDRLAGPNTLLNLSYSFIRPFCLQFERRIFCDLDPSEIFYWMTKMEMGQSHHHEFWTIGLNVHGRDCRLPKSPLKWRTFYPLADTQIVFGRIRRRERRSSRPSGNGIGTAQWKWTGNFRISRRNSRSSPISICRDEFRRRDSSWR